MTDAENNPSSFSRMPVHHYSSRRKFGIIATFKSFIKELPISHSLGFRFAERNIKSRYRQSIFGILWAFLPPLATAIIWIILNEAKVISVGDVGAPYPLFVITGTMLWSVFSNAVMMPMQVMQTNRNILVKINFPREALVINAFYEILFNAGVAFIIIILELIFFQVHLTVESLLFIPAIFMLILLGMALGLLILPFSLLYRDIQFALPPLLQFGMYLTPVVYAKPLYEGATKLMALNPVTPVLVSARAWLLGLDTALPAPHILIVLGISVVLLLLGLILQRITVEILIERMGS